MLVRAFLGLVGGYAIGVAIGLLLVAAFSDNRHDRSIEMATTSALITGPAFALVGLGVGLLSGRRHRGSIRSE